MMYPARDRLHVATGGRYRRHLLLAISTLLLTAACGTDEVAEPVEALPPDTALLSAEAVAIAGFELDTVRRVPWVLSGTAPARVILDPDREQLLGSIVEGRVTQVMVRVGDAVRAGDVLVSIHSHEIMDARSGLVGSESAVRTAEAEREAARMALERAQRLLAAQAIGQAALEQALVVATSADARYAAAEAELHRARGLIEHLLGEGPLPANLDPHDVLIRAPIGGLVTSRDVVPGTVVLPGDPLITVADPKALQLELRLTDRQVEGIRGGTPLTFTLVGESAGGAVGRAVVSRVSPVADEGTRTTMVIAEIEQSPSGTRAERFATAHFDASTTMDVANGAVLRVPRSAVQALAGDTVVIVAEQRGTELHIAAVPVRVGRRDAAFAEVLVGLTEGQVIVARGAIVARAELLKRREGGGSE